MNYVSYQCQWRKGENCNMSQMKLEIKGKWIDSKNLIGEPKDNKPVAKVVVKDNKKEELRKRISELI